MTTTSANPTFKSFVSSISNKPADKSMRSRHQKDLQREILKALVSDKLTQEEADELLNLNEAERTPGTLMLKVSEKGALSVYGLQRMPVTLYSEQWVRLLAMKPEIEAFLEAHKDQFSTKEKKQAAAQ